MSIKREKLLGLLLKLTQLKHQVSVLIIIRRNLLLYVEIIYIRGVKVEIQLKKWSVPLQNKHSGEHF
jgi:hypothetical protein